MGRWRVDRPGDFSLWTPDETVAVGHQRRPHSVPAREAVGAYLCCCLRLEVTDDDRHGRTYRDTLMFEVVAERPPMFFRKEVFQ